MVQRIAKNAVTVIPKAFMLIKVLKINNHCKIIGSKLEKQRKGVVKNNERIFQENLPKEWKRSRIQIHLQYSRYQIGIQASWFLNL